MKVTATPTTSLLPCDASPAAPAARHPPALAPVPGATLAPAPAARAPASPADCLPKQCWFLLSLVVAPFFKEEATPYIVYEEWHLTSRR